MIEYYSGIDGPTIVVESPDELLEAIDLIHTQVMDNIGEDSPLLRVLEKCMDEISKALTGKEQRKMNKPKKP